MKSLFLFLGIVLMAKSVLAQEAPPLDPDYQNIRPPVVYPQNIFRESRTLESLVKVVTPLQVALEQTPVKSQGRRGTCSIFSSTAILEYNLKKLGITTEDLDLSEQWLEYITSGQRGSEGSWSYYNFDKYGNYGYLNEEDWSYNFATWHPYDESYWENAASEEDTTVFEEYCLDLKGTQYFEGCLIGQMDPRLLNIDEQTLLEKDEEFYGIKSAARMSIDQKLKIGSEWMFNNLDIQDNLDRGEVIALDITIFYEAWNHGAGDKLGLDIDRELWGRGIVSYPHPSSLDTQKSREKDVRAGHSIVLVGYDNDVEITREVQDRSGHLMTVTTKGVYYFKNSWGQNSFGVDFTLQEQSLPGFGMISMDYAHEHGSFYKMKIERLAE